eukprot:661622-Prymnesium_polylepis.1
MRERRHVDRAARVRKVVGRVEHEVGRVGAGAQVELGGEGDDAMILQPCRARAPPADKAEACEWNRVHQEPGRAQRREMCPQLERWPRSARHKPRSAWQHTGADPRARRGRGACVEGVVGVARGEWCAHTGHE